MRLESVSLRFERTGTAALEAFDLSLAPGEFVSLLGPSGCGKSTLLRVVAGLLAPGGGRVQRGDAAHPGAVGFVFQEPTLLPWADVRANVGLPLRLLGVPRREREARVAQALELVALGGFERARPRELSGGMQMRVSLARALVQKPRLLLLDEPFAALDEITRFKLNDDLLRLWRHEGCSVLFVTHSVFESVYLSQRVVVVTPRPGRVAGEVHVDLPQPRSPELRTSAAYVERCRSVSDLLSSAMGAAGAGSGA